MTRPSPTTVAALYIDPRGPYPALPGVDCWDEARDARRYDGPHPVLAHPPCGPWGHQRHLYHGSEHDCAPRAVEQVRQWGGVLEHPARSLLWDYCDLPRPGDATDAYGGRTYELDQCDWGHVARKRTWIYVVRVDQRRVMAALRRRAGTGTPTHWCSGGRTKSSRSGGAVPPGIKVCSAQQRRRTPPVFAEFLVELARAAKGAA